MQINYTARDVERFWRHVDKTGECWIWTGSRDARGYGGFALKRPGGFSSVRAHRVAWTISIGPIPAGLNVCHHCDNPPCVRPDHLFVGTQLDNRLDCIAKGRNRPLAFEKRARGEQHGMARLNWEAVRKIRATSARGVSLNRLARAHGVSKKAVLLVVQGKTWRE